MKPDGARGWRGGESTESRAPPTTMPLLMERDESSRTNISFVADEIASQHPILIVLIGRNLR